MKSENLDLATLIGSRICHDLISPIGAIDNGLELLGMAGNGMSPEMSLINESVSNASARIRFFRLAFGAAGTQEVSIHEIRSILRDVSAGQKVNFSWKSDRSVPRSDVRAIFLAEQCLETAMPYGGDITIEPEGAQWRVTGQASKFNVDEKLWSVLGGGNAPKDILPAHVHFPLLAHHCRAEERSIQCKLTGDNISIVL